MCREDLLGNILLLPQKSTFHICNPITTVYRYIICSRQGTNSNSQGNTGASVAIRQRNQSNEEFHTLSSPSHFFRVHEQENHEQEVNQPCTCVILSIMLLVVMYHV